MQSAGLGGRLHALGLARAAVPSRRSRWQRRLLPLRKARWRLPAPHLRQTHRADLDQPRGCQDKERDSMMSHPLRCTLAAVAALSTLSVTVVPALADTGDEPSSPAADPAVVDLADADATAETRSLFAYLQDPGGILFGHQHTTDYGETFDARDGTSSDVLAATGDYPAVFGFDTLIIEGGERPGTPDATREENALTLAQSIVEAHELGGISTLS